VAILFEIVGATLLSFGTDLASLQKALRAVLDSALRNAGVAVPEHK